MGDGEEKNMRDVTIRDYIGRAKEITAEEVMKLPEGSKVIVHRFDRRGVHCTEEMTVVQSYKKKVLMSRDYYGNKREMPIKRETDRFCYTEVIG